MKNLKKENRIFSKKNILVLFAISILCVSVNAQSQTKAPNEFSIFCGGSYSFFNYQKPLSGVHGISSTGFSADLGISYTAFVGKHIGFHIGLGAGMYNVSALIDSFTFVTPNCEIPAMFGLPPDLYGTGQPYDLYTTLSGYDEKHSVYFISIPVMLLFQTMPTRPHKSGIMKNFYLMTGVKLNIPIKMEYDIEIKELKNIAHFTQLDNWAGTQNFADLGRFKGNTATGKLKNAMLVFAFEAGVKWYSSKKIIIYTGGYFDCSLTDISKKNRKPVNDFISEESMANISLLEFYNKSFLMGVGIKLRLSFINPSTVLPCR